VQIKQTDEVFLPNGIYSLSTNSDFDNTSNLTPLPLTPTPGSMTAWFGLKGLISVN